MVIVFLLFMIAWPVLSLIEPIFSKANFRFWIVLSLGSSVMALAVATIFPIWEARESLATVRFFACLWIECWASLLAGRLAHVRML